MLRIPVFLPDIMQPVPAPLEPVQPFRVFTPGASPYVYQARAREALYVNGGLLTSLQVNRGAASLTLGLLSGGQLVELNIGDSVRLAYLTPPQITIIPR